MGNSGCWLHQRINQLTNQLIQPVYKFLDIQHYIKYKKFSSKFEKQARVVELVDTPGLEPGGHSPWEFESPLSHFYHQKI